MLKYIWKGCSTQRYIIWYTRRHIYFKGKKAYISEERRVVT